MVQKCGGRKQEKMSEANESRQKQRTVINILPLVSLASGIYPLVLTMLLRWFVEIRHPDVFGFLVDIGSIVSLVLIPTGFICGLHYLVAVKTGNFGLRICAMLGTALSAFWICMFFVMLKQGFLSLVTHVN